MLPLFESDDCDTDQYGIPRNVNLLSIDDIYGKYCYQGYRL